MKDTTRIRILTAMLAMFVLAGSLTGCDKKPEVPDTPTASNDSSSDATTAQPATDAGTVGQPADGSTPPSDTPATVSFSLYWVEAGENALGVTRTVPYTKAVATAAMKELLAGPTATEKTTWPAISTAIPAGTKLLGLTISDGVAKVDLSSEFESGGGTFSVTARLAQVVYTLEQFPTIDGVEFYVDGKKVEMFSSEGVILDGPQRLDDYQDLLPIDA